MTIRRLGPADWATLREVRLRSLTDAPEAFGSTYERELGFDPAEWQRRAGDNGWFLATRAATATDTADDVASDPADGVLGIVAGICDPELPADQRQLVAMWVDPKARGTGAAEQLIDAVLGWARQAGATELTLGVAVGNLRARAVYLRTGFVPTGERIRLRGDTDRQMEILARPL